MIRLWDSNEKGVNELFEDMDSLIEFVKNYYTEKGFKSYYWRQCVLENGKIMIDYGSHSHLFYYRTEPDHKEKGDD